MKVLLSILVALTTVGHVVALGPPPAVATTGPACGLANEACNTSPDARPCCNGPCVAPEGQTAGVCPPGVPIGLSKGPVPRTTQCLPYGTSCSAGDECCGMCWKGTCRPRFAADAVPTVKDSKPTGPKTEQCLAIPDTCNSSKDCCGAECISGHCYHGDDVDATPKDASSQNIGSPCTKQQDCGGHGHICLDGRCHPHFSKAVSATGGASPSTQCVWTGCGPDRPCCGRGSFCYDVDGSKTCSHRRGRVEAAHPPAAAAAAAAAQQCIGKECDVFAGQGTESGCCLAALCIEDATGRSSLGGFCQPRR